MERAEYIQSLRRDIAFSDTLRGHTLQYRTTWGLFSPRGIDAGTRLLLDHMDVQETDDCFDLGCGYGPIGLTLARLAPKGQTLLVDKDFVAVEYTRTNAALNGITNAEAVLSNGFSHAGDRRFHLVTSNLPAKVGKEMLYLYLYDAFEHLHPGGRIYVVTITGLRRFIERAFKEVFGNYDKVKQGREYTVAMARKPE
ncbi:class I SAM-dependent methyltransferase [Ectothiorhodospira variabilis]|uniref:class I SAM-dependent methyltransferase n=1 Tax=Ectothiorhodospira variabilis TaxID=505694 RepID=UPI001EFAEE98|nr:methyltransferase [Ectothiorhodospira variabilis]MCG5494385.1 methyltransferase [Ectothiorhodospira variabilis]MCG5504152.1 methyltransferase [Ectothiorhodospira variabilis]MCG5507307.1 methyltransferase [Ectothiorhodospira variabilis]